MKLDLESFAKLEALHKLIEENDLAIIEANIRLKTMETAMNRLSTRLPRIKDSARLNAMLRDLPELMQHRSKVETQLFNDRNNRMLFFDESKTLAEKFDLWKEPTKPSR